MEEWISFGRALELILERTGSSIGRVENILRQALASSEVRFRRHSVPVTEEPSRPVRREAGLVIVIGGHTERDELNYDDLQDWFDRNHPKPAPPPKAPVTDTLPSPQGGPVPVVSAVESPSPDESTIADSRSREEVLADYFKAKHEAGEHPKHGEAMRVLKAAGKTWDRESFRERFRALARSRGFRVGKGLR